jgi:hypothetical protein
MITATSRMSSTVNDTLNHGAISRVTGSLRSESSNVGLQHSNAV